MACTISTLNDLAQLPDSELVACLQAFALPSTGPNGLTPTHMLRVKRKRGPSA